MPKTIFFRLVKLIHMHFSRVHRGDIGHFNYKSGGTFIECHGMISPKDY